MKQPQAEAFLRQLVRKDFYVDEVICEAIIAQFKTLPQGNDIDHTRFYTHTLAPKLTPALFHHAKKLSDIYLDERPEIRIVDELDATLRLLDEQKRLRPYYSIAIPAFGQLIKTNSIDLDICSIPAAAISNRLFHYVEERVGVQLFSRTGRGVSSLELFVIRSKRKDLEDEDLQMLRLLLEKAAADLNLGKWIIMDTFVKFLGLLRSATSSSFDQRPISPIEAAEFTVRRFPSESHKISPQEFQVIQEFLRVLGKERLADPDANIGSQRVIKVLEEILSPDQFGSLEITSVAT